MLCCKVFIGFGEIWHTKDNFYIVIISKNQNDGILGDTQKWHGVFNDNSLVNHHCSGAFNTPITDTGKTKIMIEFIVPPHYIWIAAPLVTVVILFNSPGNHMEKFMILKLLDMHIRIHWY